MAPPRHVNLFEVIYHIFLIFQHVQPFDECRQFGQSATANWQKQEGIQTQKLSSWGQPVWSDRIGRLFVRTLIHLPENYACLTGLITKYLPYYYTKQKENQPAAKNQYVP